MSRNAPAMLVAVLSGLCTSLLAGLFIASWTVGGIQPAYAAPPRVERDPPHLVAPTDGWREAGYERMGLWESEHDLDAEMSDG